MSNRDLEARKLFGRAVEALRLGRSREAVLAVRKAARLMDDPITRAIQLSAILIDAGVELGKASYIREGVAALQSVEGGVSKDIKAAFHYNLGNGYSYLGQREQGFGAGTRPSLALAARHLAAAVDADPTPEARVNLAGVLMSEGRWIEAFDEFNRVVLEEPTLHNAWAGRGSCLVAIYNWTVDHKAVLMSALTDYETAIELSRDDPVFQGRYRRSLANLRRRGIGPRIPDVVAVTADQKWIWANRLALNPCPLCEIESPEAFDLYPLARHLGGGRRRPPLEDLFDMVNAVCQAYSSARWTLYKALSAPLPETDHVISVPGTQGAIHNLRVGLTMAALTGFYGVLGKIGFALNSYYQLGHAHNKVTFQSIWRPRTSPSRSFPTSRSDLHPKLVRTPAASLSALHRVALSLEFGLGRYESLRKLRNHVEHHLVVAVEREKQSPYYRSVEPAFLESEAIRLGQIVKATIWYFGAAVLRGEQERLKRALRRDGVVARGEGEQVRRA